jgi:hypothetical protein
MEGAPNKLAVTLRCAPQARLEGWKQGRHVFPSFEARGFAARTSG